MKDALTYTLAKLLIFPGKDLLCLSVVLTPPFSASFPPI